ncbi:acyl-CoA synthetase family member 2, mitochondrial [Plakobranchus ocellatus]|uniref:Acyl-CoA synthetase family member 2, mitochondrial n=1 Tax=Plakobranchus ocellatus TaxID=259542 RepID=A0AAV4CST5_9GAST|nr:acyl-CoA synthetase family member 2, mitochondrial [Plakobranchus ocellatus]
MKNKMNRKLVTVPGGTITELVEHWGSVPENDISAFVSVDSAGRKRQITRAEVLQFSKRFAAKLRMFGIKKGHIVCNTLPNSIERVVCEFGIMFSGAASMNGQVFRSDGEDLVESLRAAQCVAIITDPSVPKGARDVLLEVLPLGCEDSVQSEILPHLQRLILCQRNDASPDTDFLTSLQDCSLPQYAENISPADLATVMTTSGSTGYSKLVKLSHSNICHFAIQVKGIEALQSGAHFINCAPMGWAGGYPQWYLSCGVTRYFVDLHDGFVENLPLVIWRTIVQEKIEYGFLSPMYVNTILSNEPLWKDAPWKPRTLCLAGQPVKQSQLAIIGRLCETVDINYGATECNLITTHRIQDPSEFSDSCAGYPGYGVHIKVVDQYRNEVPHGEVGEVLLWSPALCSGYLSNESATRKAFTQEGWFCTDDSGYFGPDGKLYLQGRQSDGIHRGAYILYPSWLETKLRAVPGVKDIMIVPVPDPVLHNEICACVVVDGLKGVVAGQNVDTDSRSCSSSAGDESPGNVDDVDNIQIVHKSGVLHSFLENQHGQKSTGFDRSEKQSVQPNKTFDDIRTQGQSKPLSSSYNVTSVKPIPDVIFHNSEHDQEPRLEMLEKEMRNYASALQILHKSDAMRMVPKYYVFMDKYPLTDTGKTSRKETKTLAASALHLL